MMYLFGESKRRVTWPSLSNSCKKSEVLARLGKDKSEHMSIEKRIQHLGHCRRCRIVLNAVVCRDLENRA